MVDFDMSGSNEFATVEVPADLVSRVEARVAHTEFDDVDEYVTYALGEVLTHIEAESDTSETQEVNEQEVRTRLKSLGYLNE